MAPVGRYWVYTHGEPTGRTGVRPGQLVVCRRGSKTVDGIVVEADGDGRSTQVVTGGPRITLVDARFEVHQVDECWTLSIEPRTHATAMAAFYGERSALFDLVSRMWALAFDEVSGRTFVYDDPVGTWCFLGRTALSVVLSVTPDGVPLAGLTHGSQHPRIERIPADKVSAVWVPRG